VPIKTIEEKEAVAKLKRAGGAWNEPDTLERAFPGAVLVEPLSSDALRRKSDGMAGGFLIVFRQKHPQPTNC